MTGVKIRYDDCYFLKGVWEMLEWRLKIEILDDFLEVQKTFKIKQVNVENVWASISVAAYNSAAVSEIVIFVIKSLANSFCKILCWYLVHGFCKKANECVCQKGWKGNLCNQGMLNH